MCEDSSFTSAPANIYEEDLNEETVCDLSSQGLQSLPELKNSNYLCGLYLQNNKITSFPEDFFQNLPHLLYLDVRCNELNDLPKTIQNHQNLTHLLLQNNRLTSLPNELGTVINLKVLQIGGNPIMYPPREVLKAGTSSIIKFLLNKYIESNFISSQSDESDSGSNSNDIIYSQEFVSFNSVLDVEKLQNNKTLSVQFNEKKSEDSDDEFHTKNKGKCPKLAKSRLAIPSYYQSSKYLKKLEADSMQVHNEKMKRQYLNDLAIKKHKDLLATRDKILQGRKNLELLKNWRRSYHMEKFTADGSYKLDHRNFPYDTNAEYSTLLSREDIEKDLPDKYKKKLLRRCKPTVPRKSNNDVHLALKIKQLFENLEAIDLNKKDVTPRTEQKILLNEIQKITEIKQKLMELSTKNVTSVADD